MLNNADSESNIITSFTLIIALITARLKVNHKYKLINWAIYFLFRRIKSRSCSQYIGFVRGKFSGCSIFILLVAIIIPNYVYAADTTVSAQLPTKPLPILESTNQALLPTGIDNSITSVIDKVLKLAGVPADIDGRLDAAEDLRNARRADTLMTVPSSIGWRPVTSLIFESFQGVTLNTGQLERIRVAVRAGRYPLLSLLYVMPLLRDKDSTHWPEMSLVFLQMPSRVEEDSDVFPPVPRFGQGESVSIGLRHEIINNSFHGLKLDSRLIPVAHYELDNFKTSYVDGGDVGGSGFALQYLAAVDTPESRDLVVTLLDSPFRSVAGTAAMLAGKRQIKSAVPGLLRLVNSPSPRMNALAVEALKILGVSSSENAEPSHVLAAAQLLAQRIRSLGLRDDMILPLLSNPATMIENAPWYLNIPQALPRPSDQLTDPWRIKQLDAASVRHRAAEYHQGFETADNTPGVRFAANDLTGPLLLVAAMAQNDNEAMRLIYQDICDEFENDLDALQPCVDYLATHRLSVGLIAFQKFDDAGAEKIFQQMEDFSPYDRPLSSLHLQLKKSRMLAFICRQRLSVPAPTGQEPSDPVQKVTYWISRLPEMSGQTNSYMAWTWQPGGDNSEPADRLLKLGRTALPALVEAAGDGTPTHIITNFDISGESLPVGWIGVSELAREIIQSICNESGLLLPPKPLMNRHLEPPTQARERLRKWLKLLPTTNAP